MTHYAWHFSEKPDRLAHTGEPMRVGQWLELPPDKPVIICCQGYHASYCVINALAYAAGPWVSLCEVDPADVQEQPDKICARRRRHLWCIDATDELRLFARLCALDVLHLWDAPAVVREWLETGREEIESAARSAAESATESAAWLAARSAAESATESATESAAWLAARSAARSAAWSAAWSAAESAAESAAWLAQNDVLESLLLTAGGVPE